MIEPIKVTTLVTNVLERLRIRYFICGSLASILYGTVRATQDSDIVADMKMDHVSSFYNDLVDEFYIDEEMINDAVFGKTSFNILHRDSMFKVDVFISDLRSFHQSQFERAQRHVLSEEPLIEAVFATSEDTVLAKLDWFRLGGGVSERQWMDIIGMLIVQGKKLDLIYLHKWAEMLDLKDLLDRAIKVAGNSEK